MAMLRPRKHLYSKLPLILLLPVDSNWLESTVKVIIVQEESKQ
jgi:hypothetical protein